MQVTILIKTLSVLILQVLILQVLIISTFITVGLATAQESGSILPGDVKISTPTYKAELEPALGTYVYEVSWQGIPAAEVSLGVERPEEDYQIWTRVKTYGLVDVFYKLRYNAEATLSGADFHPLRSYYYHQENSRIKETTLSFLDDGAIHSIYINRGNKVEYSFDPDNFTLDPFSASFIARGLDWDIGKTHQLDAFNGKTRYLITLKATDRVQKRTDTGLHDTWVIEPSVKNLTAKKQSKLRNARIYLTADAGREILEIQSEVFVGSVKTKLVSFTPSKKSVQGTRLAMEGSTEKSTTKLGVVK